MVPLLLQSKSCTSLVLSCIIVLSFSLTVYCARSKSRSTPEFGSKSSSSTSSPTTSSGSTTGQHIRDLISAQYHANHQETDNNEVALDSWSPEAGADQEVEHFDDHYLSSGGSTSKRVSPYSQSGFYTPVPGKSSGFMSAYDPSSGNGWNSVADHYKHASGNDNKGFHNLRHRAGPPPPPRPPPPPGPPPPSGGGWPPNFYGKGSGDRYYRQFDQDPTLAADDPDDAGKKGWDWKPAPTVSTDAVGLLALLGLLSLLSTVLQFLTTTTTAASGRRKRSVNYAQEETSQERSDRIFSEILPHLTPVANAVDGLIPLECTLRGVCISNRMLVKELGFPGRPAGQKVSSAIGRLLGSRGVHAPPTNGTIVTNTSFKDEVMKAGIQGRNGRKCEKIYPTCDALKGTKGPGLPFAIRMHDLPQLIEKVSQIAKGNFVKGFHLNL